LGRTLETAVVNPDAKSPLMRRSSNEPYMGWGAPPSPPFTHACGLTPFLFLFLL
jgi:hypothetical protein